MRSPSRRANAADGHTHAVHAPPANGGIERNPTAELLRDLRDAMRPVALLIRAVPPGDLGASTLDVIRSVTVPILAEYRQMYGQVGSVVGIIVSEGLENKEANLSILAASTVVIGNSVPYPVYSSVNVIPPALQRVLGPAVPQSDFRMHHRLELERAGVTDMFFTPRWPISRGTLDEKDAAEELGITMHFRDGDVELRALRALYRPGSLESSQSRTR